MQNQIVAEQGIGHNLKAERFVETVEQQTELILTTENGMSNIKIEKHADSWNKWLTTSTIDVTVEYNAKVSIKTDDITFIQTDKGLTIVVDQDDIEVTSVEIVNKNCIMGRSIFGQGFSEDEKKFAESEINAFNENPMDGNVDAIVNKIFAGIGQASKKAVEDAKIAEQNSAKEVAVEDIFSEMCAEAHVEEEEDLNIF